MFYILHSTFNSKGYYRVIWIEGHAAYNVAYSKERGLRRGRVSPRCPPDQPGRGSTLARSLPRRACRTRGVGACVWAERWAGHVNKLTGTGDAVCRLWGHPKHPMYSWQTTPLTIPQVIGRAGWFTLSALLFLATFPLASSCDPVLSSEI